MDGTPEAIQGLGRFLAKHGVTNYLATTVTADPQVIIAAIENLVNCPQPQNGAQHLGAHIEGRLSFRMNIEACTPNINSVLPIPKSTSFGSHPVVFA